LHESKVVVVSIARPFDEVYDFLAQPKNLAHWGTNFGSEIQHIEANDYLVDIPSGEVVIRFTPPNTLGVIDFTLFARGAQPGPATPARVYPNGEGTDIAITLFRAPGITDDKFKSDEEWMRSDLSRLKAVLEEDA
jgi:hypothetical protein